MERIKREIRKISKALGALVGLVVIVALADNTETQLSSGELSDHALHHMQARLGLFAGAHRTTEDDLELQMTALATARQCSVCGGFQEYSSTSAEQWIPLQSVLYNEWKMPAFTVVPGVCHRVNGSSCDYQPRMVLYVWNFEGTNLNLRIDDDGNLFERDGVGWRKLDSDPSRVKRLMEKALNFARGVET